MKHVFYVHSHTTYLTSIGIINLLNLTDNEIVFVISRYYKNNTFLIPYQTIEMSDIFFDSMKKGEVFYFWKLNKLVKQIDIKLNDLIPNRFIAYLPHVGVFLPQVIATNPKCYGLRLIEEGINCYSLTIGSYKYTIRETVKLLLNYCVNQYRRYWFTDYPFYFEFLENRFVVETETYGLSYETFKGLKYNKNIVKWPTTNSNLVINVEYPIYIFEAAIEQKFIGYNRYMSSVKAMINQTFNVNSYVKFHPAQSAINIQIIKNIFDELNINLIVLPIDTPFELIILQYKNLKIYGFGSSLLLYAKNLGHQVHSFENLLLEDSLYIRYKKLVDYRF